MIKKIFLITFFSIFLLPLSFFFWWNSQTLPVDSKNKETKVFVIPPGLGVDQIGQRLKDEKLIKNTLAFKIMVGKEGIAKKLQAGDFRLSPSMNLFEIAQALTHGTLDIWVTIPEGLRREEIAVILKNSFAKQGIEFDSDGFLNKTVDLEGFLFPDTYLIPKNASSDDIIKILRDNFEKKYASLTLSTNLTEKQIITLASLIEREVKHDKDRPIAAGILIKRLRKGWPLQVDATIQYAKANIECQMPEVKCQWWPKVIAKDLGIDSPYNTYKNQGLPPTPICNPGLASLKAVVEPLDSEYWYYLSDNSGNIHYAKTLEEHEENIRKYLR